ncbi:MAG: DUF1648 domain-containing protein [Corynebacterium pollutisoli]|uniref:DUF1648 domain-containing protein n=1 Tax=Corynebacterium pollutisoli TaxID=1610489 RepID=A0A7X8MV51_9CORY|nr:DUF1648 domain-containing protein [Corynebacterium pollutisoli]
MLERVAWLVPTGAALVSAVLIVAAMPVLPAEVASQWNNDGPTSTMSPWGFLALPAIGLVVGLIGAGLAPGWRKNRGLSDAVFFTAAHVGGSLAFSLLPVGMLLAQLEDGRALGEPRGNAVIAIGVAFLLAVGFHHLVLRAERQSIPRSP